ncbi:hypothetical protein AB0C86_06010 [Streptomyces lavendulae]|uniref:hypothetical protein n=1 Tax=Streptomyces lavendulae TaxID=1914 RepID=UPI0033DB538B
MIGSEDPKVTPQEAAARAAHTEDPFTLKVFSRGHFYLVRDHAEVIRTMTDHLRTPVTPRPRPPGRDSAFPPGATADAWAIMADVHPRPSHHPVRLFARDTRPFAHRPELLREKPFWRGHLSACLRDGIPRSWLGPHDPIAHRAFWRRLWAAGDRPVFTVPVADGLSLHVLYENAGEDAGVHYLISHPDWEHAEFLARDDGHRRGPGLSWPELIGAADNGLPGGTTTDPDTRLLLLLPALGDADLPAEAGRRLAACLRSRLGAAEPGRLAAAVLRRQGMAGRARWSTGAAGVRVDDGRYSFRNPGNRDALPDCRLAQVSAALTPRKGAAPPGSTPFHGDRSPDDCRPGACRATPRATATCPRRAEYTTWLAALMTDSPPF